MKNARLSKVIAEVAREKNITQIVLGQTAQSRWEQMTKGSLLTLSCRKFHLLIFILFRFHDLLVIKKVFLKKDVRAYLVKDQDQYRLAI